MATHYLPYMSVMKVELTFNQALDVITKQEGQFDKFERLSMLIDLYFPKVKLEFQSLLAARDEANTILNTYKARYKAGNTMG